MRFYRVKRRGFLVTVCSLGLSTIFSGAISAQTRTVRIGILATAQPTPAMLNAFRDGMRTHGYVEGRNLVIDVRSPKGTFAQDPGIVAELIGSGIDVLVAWPTPAARAAQRATSTIPIVMLGTADPVGTGLVASLAHPGKNITGLSNMGRELSAKLVELLTDILPGIRRIGVVHNSNNPAVVLQLKETENAIRALGLESESVQARLPDEFGNAFARLHAAGITVVVMVPDASTLAYANKIAELAAQMYVATIFQRRENVEAGGLMSYGPNLPDQFGQAASYVAEILKGAKPSELPVQQAAKYELIINAKTAKALGITVPPSLLARADDVIE